jgi:7,8-dihydropterin-6-yl-methyl-4-(beta-D-ribofuranosyl)aminobenzene 5'-phosphate synthase
MTLTLKVVFDNEPGEPSLQTSWGFACMVEGLAEPLLFDTGGDGAILLANMKKMGLDPAGIRTAVISHSHYDHARGLEILVDVAKGLKIYLPPDDYPERLKGEFEAKGAEPVLGENGQEIVPGAYLIQTAAGGRREQALALKTGETTALLTGCAHPGIVEVARNAAQTLGAASLLVIGGLHLRGDDPAEFTEIAARLRECGVTKIGPAHCTSETARAVLARKFGENFLQIALGSVVEVE